MNLISLARMAAAGAVLAAVLFMGTLLGPRPGRAQNGNGNGSSNDGLDEQAMISQGYAIAPVPLNTVGKDSDLVGLGSYLVNAVADCNGCHNDDPFDSEFTGASNPYLLPPPNGSFTGSLNTGPIKVNPATYLAGGQFFGTVDFANSAPIVSRNLTPNYQGMAEGGRSLSDFLKIIQMGVDMDNLHPQCAGAENPSCIPAPYNGAKLQVMPWAIFRNMTTRQLTAIYTYLSAIPCIDNTGQSGIVLPQGYPAAELTNQCSR